MNLPPSRGLRSESGATIVEFTLVFLFLVLPLVLFGMQLVLSTFIREQATAAARDGARTAIVSYLEADIDVPPSDDFTRVTESVKARLAFPPKDVTVVCLAYDEASPTRPGEMSCGEAERGVDRVEVAVTMEPIQVVGPFGIFLDPLLPDEIKSTASMVVENDGTNS